MKKIGILIICVLTALIIGFVIYKTTKISNENVETVAVVDDEIEEKDDIFEIILENTEINEEQLDNENEYNENDTENNIENNEEVRNTEKVSQERQENNKQQTSNVANYNSSNSLPYYIKVNNQANVVTIYGKDENGNYSKPIKAMICSTGKATPSSGKYTVKGRWEWLNLINGVYGHYSTQIVGNILFHSVPYTEKWNPGSLEYWEYDKLRNSLLSWLCKTYYSRCKMDF